MAKRKPIRVEIVDDADQRFIIKTFADGEQEREPVVKLPRKKRGSSRPYWHWNIGKAGKR